MDLETDSRSPAQPRNGWDTTGVSRRGVRHPAVRSARSLAPTPAADTLGLSLTQAFGMVAHELSTPLTTVAIAAGTLRGSAGAGEELVDVIISQVQRLQSVVADLLDVSRLDHGAIVARPERRQATQLVSQALAALGEEVPSDWVSVYSPGRLPAVRVDGGFAQRILVNLVRNAARHGAPPIQVALEPDGSTLRVTVRDAGAGVPDEALAGLFQPYRSYGATGRLGLGLALSRALAHAMGSELLLHSATPACFVLTMPFDQSEAR